MPSNIAAIATLWWYFFSSVHLVSHTSQSLSVYYPYTYIGHLRETIMQITCECAWFEFNALSNSHSCGQSYSILLQNLPKNAICEKHKTFLQWIISNIQYHLSVSCNELFCNHCINHWPVVIMGTHVHIGKYSMLTPHIQDIHKMHCTWRSQPTQSAVPTHRLAQWQVSILLHGHWISIDNSNTQP